MFEYDFTDIINHVAHKENIKKPKLELKSTSNKGDGFLGTIVFGKLSDINDKYLNLVFKYSHRDSKVHKKLPLRDIYLNEIRFYEVIMPAFMKFQTERNIKSLFHHVPKYYASIQDPLNELLVMNDLKFQNFAPWNRKELMNEKHLLMFFETYAKFHGTSLAMQIINPDWYNNLKRGMTDMFQTIMEKLDFYRQLTECLKSTTGMFDPITEKNYRDKFENVCNNVQDYMISAFNFHENDVILHGDCFNNNVLFEYNDLNNREQPESMAILDFQFTKLGSPALDLVFFFYTIAPKIHFDRLEYFLVFYHTCMKQHLKMFQLNIEDIFPYDKLFMHWKRVCIFGLIISFTVRRAMFINDDDVPDMTENTENFISSFKLRAEGQKLYHQQMKHLVMHFIDRKFI